MKIVNSTVGFSSDHFSEQMDLSLTENETKKTVQRERTGPQIRWDLPQVIVDRVSISRQSEREYQSAYSGRVSSRSSVSSANETAGISFEEISAVEKLVGGIIEKDVVIRAIQAKTDLGLSDEAVSDSGPEHAGGPAPDIGQDIISQGWQMALKRTDLHFETETMQFESAGQVMTEDGRVIDFSLAMSLDRTFLSRTEQETLVERWQERVNLTDPLVISLDGRVPELADATFEFDLNADGKTEHINFTSAGSGFLAFDKNQDSIINDGSELFGPGTGNGFKELAAYDGDGNGWIDENDAVFSKLSVWTRDKNGRNRLVSLKDAGIGAISLDYIGTGFSMTETDNTLNGRMKGSGVFLFEDGRAGSLHQIDLVSHALENPENELPMPETVMENPAAGLRLQRLSDSGMIRPGMALFSPAQSGETGEVPGPLKDLLDRIEELKKEMEKLFENASYPSRKAGRSHGTEKRSYTLLTPDPSLFLFNRKGTARPWSRYA